MRCVERSDGAQRRNPDGKSGEGWANSLRQSVFINDHCRAFTSIHHPQSTLSYSLTVSHSPSDSTCFTIASHPRRRAFLTAHATSLLSLRSLHIQPTQPLSWRRRSRPTEMPIHGIKCKHLHPISPTKSYARASTHARRDRPGCRDNRLASLSGNSKAPTT